jgi:hypothetical protein
MYSKLATELSKFAGAVFTDHDWHRTSMFYSFDKGEMIYLSEEMFH